MYGDLGNKLVQHAKRTQTLSQLPPYQNEIVRAITREVRELDNENKHTLAQHTSPNGSLDPSIDQGVATALLVNHLFLRRNKRCLLAYHQVRTQKLEDLTWRGGDLMDEQQIQALIEQERGNPAAIKGGRVQNVDALSPEEEAHFHQYNEMLISHKGHWTNIDLTGSMEPPKELFVDVRVLKDAGEIQTEYGSINLTKNSQFFVRLGDVEHLIAQGYLQRLD